MKTSKEREEEFLLDFVGLLAKHKADFEITEDHEDYGRHVGIVIITMMSEWDNSGNQTAEYTQFQMRSNYYIA